LFSAAFRAGANHGLLWLVAVALFGSFVSLYYYLIVLKVIFVDQSSGSTSQPLNFSTPGGFVKLVTIIVLAAAVLFLGIMPQTLAAKIIASLP
jgi:NADH:ubiquinone oxidoreductase subunit 2 (subunit N)